MKSRVLTLVGGLAVVLSLGCGAPEETEIPAAQDTPGQTGDTTGMEGMEGMAGMEGMGSMMMDSVRSHMQMMEGASGDSLQGMLATHRRMMGDMLARMDTEMRDMSMQPDSAWTATADSVRTDLDAMQRMSAAELDAAMAAHRGRVTRLMDMHERMRQRM